MTHDQAKLYKAIQDDKLGEHLNELFTSAHLPIPRSSQYNSRHRAMAARRVCCHPFLFPHPKYPLVPEYEPDQYLISICGKMKVLDQMLQAILNENQSNKVLIFSQFRSMIDLLQEYCAYRNYSFVSLDGRDIQLDRKDAIEQFQNHSSMRIFLATTRAGGLGINLTAANHVILYDSDWNPQMDLQAQDRAHRLGQTRPVTVFRLLHEHSIELYLYERAYAKRMLEKLVIQNHPTGSSQADLPVSLEQEEDDLLRSVPNRHLENKLSLKHDLVPSEEFIHNLESLFDASCVDEMQLLTQDQEGISPSELKKLLDMRAH
jgi:SNF2 family DNA or RNA helicase